MPAPKDPEKYELWKQRMSISRKGRISPMRGKKHSEETRKKISVAKTGKPLSQKQIDQLKQLAEINREIRIYPNGYHLSEEHKRKISVGNKGRVVSDETRRKIGLKLKGSKPSDKTRMKMRLARLGRAPYNKGKKLHYVVWNKGKKGVMPTPWNKGKRGYLTPSTLERLSQIRKGRSPINKGQKMDEVFREKCRQHRATQKFPLQDTSIERKLHEILDSINMKYRKHFPIYHPKMGSHQVDIMFVDSEGNPKIAIECDGCYWHGCKQHCEDNKTTTNARKRDKLIDACMRELGIKIIRMWEHDIKNNNITIPMEVYNFGTY